MCYSMYKLFYEFVKKSNTNKNDDFYTFVVSMCDSNKKLVDISKETIDILNNLIKQNVHNA